MNPTLASATAANQPQTEIPPSLTNSMTLPHCRTMDSLPTAYHTERNRAPKQNTVSGDAEMPWVTKQNRRTIPVAATQVHKAHPQTVGQHLIPTTWMARLVPEETGRRLTNQYDTERTSPQRPCTHEDRQLRRHYSTRPSHHTK